MPCRSEFVDKILMRLSTSSRYFHRNGRTLEREEFIAHYQKNAEEIPVRVLVEGRVQVRRLSDLEPAERDRLIEEWWLTRRGRRDTCPRAGLPRFPSDSAKIAAPAAKEAVSFNQVIEREEYIAHYQKNAEEIPVRVLVEGRVQARRLSDLEPAERARLIEKWWLRFHAPHVRAAKRNSK